MPVEALKGVKRAQSIIYSRDSLSLAAMFYLKLSKHKCSLYDLNTATAYNMEIIYLIIPTFYLICWICVV